MKLSIKIMMLLLSSLLIISIFGFSYQNEGDNSKTERRESALAFKQKYNENIKIYWNEPSGTPSMILKLKIAKYSGNPENIAMAFLTEEKKMLGIKNPAKDLRLKKINSTSSGIHAVIFEQI